MGHPRWFCEWATRQIGVESAVRPSNSELELVVESLRTFFPVLFGCFLLCFTGEVLQGQTDAQLTISQENVTAGDSVRLTLTLDQPAACDANAGVSFRTPSQPPSYVSIGGVIHKGEKAVIVESQVPFDTPAGRYDSYEGYLNPCPNYVNATRFPVPVRTLVVTAYADPNKFPTNGDLALLPTQRQFLDTKIVQLEELDSQVTTRLAGNAADVPQVRDFLVQIVNTAEADLSATEAQYRVQIMKSQGELPAFFADFHLEYQALLTDLRAPIPGMSAERVPDVPLLYVQLNRRPAVDPGNAVKNLSGTYSSDVKSVRKTISDNANAYKYVKKSGRITFDARISSFPDGARIRYKKRIDSDFKDYSMPTDIPKVTLELATWVFEFRKDGCTDKPTKEIDPYEDTDPDISVEFLHCKGAR